MILYLEDAKDSTKRLSNQINIFSDVAGYKISIQDQLLFYVPMMNSLRKEPGK
jgi:hypothetical protein